jgi:hypothetical protein
MDCDSIKNSNERAACKIGNTTKSRNVYIAQWTSYVKALRTLQWTPSRDLSEKVGKAVDELEALIPKVADDKGLK